MKLHVEVTEEDIKNGCCFRANACPVAMAMNRSLWAAGLDAHAGIGGDRIGIYRGTDCEVVWTKCHKLHAMDAPRAVYLFVLAVDSRTETPKPFSFDLEIPDDLPRLEQSCTATS